MVVLSRLSHKFVKCSGSYIASVLQNLFLTDILNRMFFIKCSICLELKHLSYSNAYCVVMKHGQVDQLHLYKLIMTPKYGAFLKLSMVLFSNTSS